MRGRRLVGIFRYDSHNTRDCPRIATRADAIHAAILRFFAAFVAAVHVDDVVFDVFIEPSTGDPQDLKVRLLELNPFSPRTDAGLFRWPVEHTEGGDFDGSFRYR